MGDPHIVPLSRDRPVSENTINAALRRLGYSGDDQTGYGFRSKASTLLNERRGRIAEAQAWTRI